jgi:excinuclease UvrABC nuclease subunit
VAFTLAIFTPAQDAEFFTSVPAAAGVFVLRGEAGSEPYVSKTSNLRRRLQRLLAEPQPGTRRLNLRDRVRTVEYVLTGSDFEAGLILYETLRHEFPKTYAQRLKLRPAPLMRFIVENAFPRVSVTTKIATLRGRSLYYGPFPSRAAAEKLMNDALDFFKIRRCVDELEPHPSHPGCMYSEMKMCLAPCFKGCTDEEYSAEVERVREFLDTGGRSLENELARQRDEARANLEFEQAQAIHGKLEKLTPVRQLWNEAIHRIDTMRAVIVQPSVERESVALFYLDGGIICGPVQFALQLKSAEHASKPQSMESRIQETLAPVTAADHSHTAQEITEHLAYFKRWYYRGSKIGEVFFADLKGELPWRRIVRGVSRVFRGEKPSPDLTEVARDYWINRGKAAELNPENYNV